MARTRYSEYNAVIVDHSSVVDGSFVYLNAIVPSGLVLTIEDKVRRMVDEVGTDGVTGERNGPLYTVTASPGESEFFFVFGIVDLVVARSRDAAV